MTIEQICERAPALQSLLDEIRRQKPDELCDRFWVAYESWKLQLQEIVGWHAADPELWTSEVYAKAHTAMMAAMPDCSDCD